MAAAAVPPPALQLDLLSAAEAGDAARCARLVREGADPGADAKPDHVGSALAAAAVHGHTDALRAMLDAAGERSLPLSLDAPVGSLGASPLRWALAGDALRTEVLQLLLERGAALSAPPASVPALVQAAGNTNMEALRVVAAALPREALDAASSSGDTAMHTAALYGKLDAVRVLLAAGASPNPPAAAESPLHYAVREGHAAIYRALVEAGADVNASAAPSGETPLHIAARREDVDAMTYLIEHGADADRPDASGATVRSLLEFTELSVPGLR